MTDKLLTTLLDEFLTEFTADVLIPTQISAQQPLLEIRPEELPKEHVYWSKRKKLIDRVRGSIRAVLVDKPEVSGYPDYPKALVGGYLNDMINLFVRQILGEVGVLHKEWDDTIFSSEHPYLQELDTFIYYKSGIFVDRLFP